MDDTIPYEDHNVRIVGNKDGQPEVLVISSNDRSSVNGTTVRDITTGVGRTMEAKIGEVTVFAKQSDGSFNQHDMSLQRPHRNLEARQKGEEKNVTPQDAENKISSVKEQTIGASFPKVADEIRQEYLNKK